MDAQTSLQSRNKIKKKNPRHSKRSENHKDIQDKPKRHWSKTSQKKIKEVYEAAKLRKEKYRNEKEQKIIALENSLKERQRQRTIKNKLMCKRTSKGQANMSARMKILLSKIEKDMSKDKTNVQI
ncbi:hypothetical protein GJ496_000555 [Pomphorhynchus laevis]|nr:hypothetical protein GJ496_000555 [Pomphorhynchus laevis]